MTQEQTPGPEGREPDVDATQEVDLNRTQEFGPAPGREPMLPAQESAPEVIWASDAQWPERAQQGSHDAPTSPSGWATDAGIDAPFGSATHGRPNRHWADAAPSTDRSQVAGSADAQGQQWGGQSMWAEQQPQGGHPGDATAYPQHFGGDGGTPPPAKTRKGPGWGAVFLIAGLAALLSGLGGGLLGGWLGSSDRFDGLDLGDSSSGPTPEPGAGATERPEGTVANIAANATPSVVTIRVAASGGDGTGSGWVLDDNGHVVTNNHVVAEAANGGQITVVLANGKQSKATIVGRDVSYDLAVLKVDRTDLKPLPLGDSSEVVVGDPVIAVGAPLGLDSTVTTGIVSALNRPVTPGQADDQSFINAIQTDAAINPGNSGGPLLDMQGRVIGVNTAIARVAGSNIDGQSGNIGVGFAIPSDQVKITVDQLIRTGKAEHPIIGVLLDRSYQGEGVRIATDSGNTPAVTPDGPADKAGLRAGDVITAFEGRPMTDPDALVVAIRSKPVGSTVTLTVVRDGKARDVKMVLQGRSD